ncbi:hypothetical protein ACYU03_22680 [Pseudomonas sp. X10]
MQLQLVANLLKRGRQLERLSDGISLLALAYGLAPLAGASPHLLASVLCALLLAVGLAQKYWAVRVALDAGLFAALASDGGPLPARTQALDQTLSVLGLKPSGADNRDWPTRSRAALRLLRNQALGLGLQVLLALAALLTLPWLPLAG